MATIDERFRGLPLLETPDLHEALRVTTEVFLPHDLQVLERSAPLRMKLNALRMGCLTVGYLRYGPEVRMRTAQAGHYTSISRSTAPSVPGADGVTRWTPHGRKLRCSCQETQPTSSGERIARSSA
jgi:AraC-binding-like domain